MKHSTFITTVLFVIAGAGSFTSAQQTCSLYLPFDDDLADHSLEGFELASSGHVVIDRTTKAHGPGSLKFHEDGIFQVPALVKGNADEASWCFFYKFNHQGSILKSEEADGQSSIHIFVDADETMKVQLSFGQQRPTLVLRGSSSTESEFHQLCVVFEAQQVSLFLDKLLVDRQTLADFKIPSGSYSLGGFEGNLDDVLMCSWALSTAEIEAHFRGEQSMSDVGMLMADVTVVRPLNNDETVEHLFENGGDFKEAFAMLQNKRQTQRSIPKQTRRLKAEVRRRMLEIFDFKPNARLSTVEAEDPNLLSADKMVTDEYFPGLVRIIGRTVHEKFYKDGKISELSKVDAFYCHGALIRWQWVLFGAECFDIANDRKIAEAHAFFGFDGSTNSFATIRRLQKVIIHGARGDNGERRFDYALAKLTTPIYVEANEAKHRILPFGIAGEFPLEHWSACPNASDPTLNATYLHPIDAPDWAKDNSIFVVASTRYGYLTRVDPGSKTKGEQVVIKVPTSIITWASCEEKLLNNETLQQQLYEYAPYDKTKQIDDTKLCTENNIDWAVPPQVPLLIGQTKFEGVNIVLGTWQAVSSNGRLYVWARTCRILDWIQAVLNSTHPSDPSPWRVDGGMLKLIDARQNVVQPKQLD